MELVAQMRLYVEEERQDDARDLLMAIGAKHDLRRARSLLVGKGIDCRLEYEDVSEAVELKAGE